MPKNAPARRPRAPMTAGSPGGRGRCPAGRSGRRPDDQRGDARTAIADGGEVQALAGVLQRRDAEHRRAAPTTGGRSRGAAPRLGGAEPAEGGQEERQPDAISGSIPRNTSRQPRAS